MKYVLVLDDEWIKKTDDGTPYVTLALRDDLTIKLIVTPIKKPILNTMVDEMIWKQKETNNGRDTTG